MRWEREVGHRQADAWTSIDGVGVFAFMEIDGNALATYGTTR